MRNKCFGCTLKNGENMIISFSKHTFGILSFLMLIQNPVFSQHTGWFAHDNFSRPFISEMYSSLTKMEAVKLNKLHPFYYISNATIRPFIEIQTGFQLPVFLHTKDHTIGNLKISVNAPVSITTLVDLFENKTAPVIDNDYRFGVQATFLLSPENQVNRFIRNYHLALVPIFHESTHIGDEFALHGFEQIPNFARINVSYEAWQVIAGINRLREPQKRNLSAEIGYQRLMPFQSGYYNVDDFEVKGVPISPSQQRDLWFFRAEYTHPQRFGNGRTSEYIASTEIRRETKFGYTADNPEKRAWSVNTYLGFRVPIKNTPTWVGIYFRHYQGVVPYGQLRDKDGFMLNGISIVVN